MVRTNYIRALIVFVAMAAAMLFGVLVSEILKLDTPPPSATAQDQRAQEEATASEQPVPDWREIFGEP